MVWSVTVGKKEPAGRERSDWEWDKRERGGEEGKLLPAGVQHHFSWLHPGRIITLCYISRHEGMYINNSQNKGRYGQQTRVHISRCPIPSIQRITHPPTIQYRTAESTMFLGSGLRSRAFPSRVNLHLSWVPACNSRGKLIVLREQKTTSQVLAVHLARSGSWLARIKNHLTGSLLCLTRQAATLASMYTYYLWGRHSIVTHEKRSFHCPVL